MARTKMESWCAYQERSHYEVKEKLYGYGLYSNEVNQILAYLVENNFLNEQRFAEAYVSGKFRIKGWGRNKIKQGLKLKKVSEYNIRHALKLIDEEDYIFRLQKTAEKKNKLIKEKHPLKRRYKLMSFLVSKGFETDLVNETVNQLLGK